MTIKQVGRTTNSVTINVSGITSHYRKTYIWIPGAILNASSGQWYPLQQAKDNGYISDFYATSVDGVNGDITIVIPNWYLQYKVVDLTVENVHANTGDVIASAYLETVLDFKYENSFPKAKGEDIDITVADMRELNLFGKYIDLWVNGGGGGYLWNDLNDEVSGDKIYAYYLRDPAGNMYDAAVACRSVLGASYGTIIGYLDDIVDECESGADFKASWFNNIVYAIRKFNFSITV